jgi:hypothetical protein
MNIIATSSRQPWNKGKLVGQKTPLRLKDIGAIRVRLQIADRVRDLALFDLAIDSKLRACDLTKLRAHDVAHIRPDPAPDNEDVTLRKFFQSIFNCLFIRHIASD